MSIGGTASFILSTIAEGGDVSHESAYGWVWMVDVTEQNYCSYTADDETLDMAQRGAGSFEKSRSESGREEKGEKGGGRRISASAQAC